MRSAITLYLELTSESGNPIWINASQVLHMEKATAAGTYVERTKIVQVGSGTLYVRKTPDEIAAKYAETQER